MYMYLLLPPLKKPQIKPINVALCLVMQRRQSAAASPKHCRRPRHDRRSVLLPDPHCSPAIVRQPFHSLETELEPLWITVHSTRRSTHGRAVETHLEKPSFFKNT